MLYFPKWKIFLVIGICLVGLITAFPNVLSDDEAESLPGWIPHDKINLGLDLQGGLHFLLEVDLKAVTEERMSDLFSDVRVRLRQARIRATGFSRSGPRVSFKLNTADDTARAMDTLQGLVVNKVPTLTSSGGPDIVIRDNGGGKIELELTEQEIEDRKSGVVDQTIEVVRNRIDELGTREPTIQRQGDSRIIVQLPGESDRDRVIGILKRTAKLTFQMVDLTTNPADAERGRIPPGSELVPADANDQFATQYVLRKRIIVSGEMLVDAQPTFQQGVPVVQFRFNSNGARRFADATRENVGKPFAVVLDGKVITAPRINEPILGGSGIITGGFTVQTANDLALLLRAGALPAPIKILEERSVGPDLGADSIAAGEFASVAGLVAVMVYIVLAYGFFGIVADMALFLNMALIAGALSTLGATLTLPGIAGIVLTIGMAVDANVLIFERIREEVRAGKTPIAALDAGYSRALGTILDANITTLIAALILFQFGSGPVKGFAVTLAIGIFTSVFTAVTVSRLMLVGWLRRTRPKALPI